MRRTPFFVSVFSLIIAGLLGFSNSAATAQAEPTPGTFIPLPGGCGGANPPNAGTPICCVSGYVFIDGEAVAGAKVTITSADSSFEVWTERGPDSDQPYYRTSLSDLPIAAEPGETITVVAEYGDQRRSVTHTVLGDGQQVDLVLPNNQSDDYVFDEQYWQPTSLGTFRVAADIAVDGSGTVYTVDNRNARIQVFNRNGDLLRNWGTFGNQPGQFADPVGIAVDAAGYVYIADTGNHRIQKFTNTGVFVTSWGEQGSADGQFLDPDDMAVDSVGNIYVADYGNHRVQKFDSSGAFLSTWGSEGEGNGQLQHPSGIAVGADDTIYVLESHNHRVQAFRPNGDFVDVWGSEGDGNGQFFFAASIAVNDSGNVYVADTSNHRIQQFTAAGDFVRTWGSQPDFNYPTGIATDANGSVYIAAGLSYDIRKYSESGQLVTSWGNQGDLTETIFGAEGVAVAPDGNIFVADTQSNRVLKFDANWELMQIIGTEAESSANGDFYSPRRIAFDSSGNFYVSDGGNGRIQKFRSDGTWLETLGSLGSGIGQFTSPEGIAIDSQDNIYIIDTQNNRVQKYVNGQWQVWGGPGSANGQFANPEGIAVDQDDNVYVADGVNYRVQKFRSDSTFVTSWNRVGSGFLGYPHGVTVDERNNVYVSDAKGHVHKFNADGQWQATVGSLGTGLGELRRPEGMDVAPNGDLYVADAENSRVQVFGPLSFTAPIATIVAASPRSLTQGQPVELLGMGGDSDSTPEIAAYEWTLNDDTTPFATTADATLNTTNLSTGRHTISLRVRDTEGEYSAPQRITIDVSPGDALGQPKTWTFLLYLAGDNSAIDPFFNRDSPLGALYRLENSAPNTQVQVVAIHDGDRPGGGDSFRYRMQPNGQFIQEPLGEINMGDPQTLLDFVRWGKQQAPADYYYLAIADHANALDGIAWDFTDGTNRTERLTNTELRQALVELTENGGQPIDVLHLDGCLMGLVENAYQVRDLADYLVASENLGWSAFAYDSYREAIGPTTDPQTFAIAIADRYAQLVAQRSYPFTISAMDLSQIYPLTEATNQLAGALLRYALDSEANRTTLQNLHVQVQKLDSSGDIVIDNRDEYVDLGHWAELVENGVDDSTVQSAAADVRTALPPFIIREHSATGSYQGITVNLDNARGVGIYYPATHTVRTYQMYKNDLNFPQATQWDEFLAAGLAALPFNADEPAPNPVAPLLLPPPAVSLMSNLYVPLVVY